jgi:hypothetical protein
MSNHYPAKSIRVQRYEARWLAVKEVWVLQHEAHWVVFAIVNHLWEANLRE